MKSLKNDRGSVLVFVTLMIVLLLVMVGMGLDVGQLGYARSTGQPAVDAAALAAASAVPTGDENLVRQRAVKYNSTNDYTGSASTPIQGANVTLVTYNSTTGAITKAANIAAANGARVALETTNPYDGGATNTPMKSPLFLTPLFKLLGQSAPNTANVSVSATAVIRAIPGMPIAIAGCAPANAGCTGGAGTEESPYTACKLLQTNSSNNSGNGNGNGNGNDNGDYQDSGWTTFTIQSANAPTIKALVGNNSTCGNIPPISVGAGCIYLNNGQITPVLREFEAVYKNNGTGLSGASNAPFSNDWGVVPVVSSSIGNFNGCEPVTGWAKFGIRDVVVGGSGGKYLIGDLICNWDINRVGGTGCYTHVLVRDKPSGM